MQNRKYDVNGGVGLSEVSLILKISGKYKVNCAFQAKPRSAAETRKKWCVIDFLVSENSF